MYLGLHVGNVFYGNVGSRERLDFTVLGPAVNEASRIAAMCRSVDQPVLMSTAFAEVGDIRRRLVSVGRYALRGVSHQASRQTPFADVRLHLRSTKSLNLTASVLLETRLVPTAAPMPGHTCDGHDGYEHHSESHCRHDASV